MIKLFQLWYARHKNNLHTKRQKKLLSRAIKRADDRKIITGKKQAVMLDYDGSYAVFGRDEFLLFRRRGRFDKKFTWTDVLEKANYVTK